MPTVDVRESIFGTLTTDAEGYGYMVKRINLPEGHKFNMQLIEIFNDNVSMPLLALGGQAAGAQIFVSPFPMQRMSDVWGAASSQFIGGGQSAGDANVLYKEAMFTQLNESLQQPYNKIWRDQFPNDEIGARPTFTWFSPHVYVTVMIWNAPDTTFDIRLSAYMKVKVTKANQTSVSMGCYQEFLESQMAQLMSTGVMVNPVNVAGYTFPMWKYGGIRPELMLSGTTALRYFNRVASNASQEMVESGDLLTAFRSATNMVPFDEPFGDAANNLPEWITLMNVQGVTSGIIRPYPPPLKYADNGNTLMF